MLSQNAQNCRICAQIERIGLPSFPVSLFPSPATKAQWQGLRGSESQSPFRNALEVHHERDDREKDNGVMELCARRTAGGCGEPNSHVADAAQDAVVQGVGRRDGNPASGSALHHSAETGLCLPWSGAKTSGRCLGRALARGTGCYRPLLGPPLSPLAHHSLSGLDT